MKITNVIKDTEHTTFDKLKNGDMFVDLQVKESSVLIKLLSITEEYNSIYFENSFVCKAHTPYSKTVIKVLSVTLED